MKEKDEIDRLVAAFVDGTLNEEDRVAFERYIRENPDALSRAAAAVRFEVALSDAVRPDHLELVQQRRMVIDRASGRPLVVESTERVGRPGTFVEHPAKPVRKRWPWLMMIPLLAALGIAGTWLAMKDRKKAIAAPVVGWTALPLKNPGFELPDLGTAPAKSHDLQSWQDKFTTENATVTSAPPGGAHGGKQVALLVRGGHLKQLLFDAEGHAITFEPGTKFRVSGWVNPVKAISGRTDAIHIALHFVDDQKRQFVVAYRIAPLDGSGWRRFTVELTVPAQETFEPSYAFSSGDVATVRGRQVLLSLTNLSYQMPQKVDFMLDDITAEILPAQ